MTRGVLAWLAIVVPLWLVLVLCTAWEPVMRDGWGHFIWHRHHDVSFGELWEFATNAYQAANPRLGQTTTLLLHTPGPWHPIVTPVVELVLFALLLTLALGRWPNLRRGDHALVFATIVALVFVSMPSLGPMLFYRPFIGNYVFALALQLAWLVPYRLHAVEARRARWWWTPGMLVLGLAAGFSNEHTGPTLIAAGVLAIVVYWRRGERLAVWAYAGVVGMTVGLLALLLAPGQAIRYSALATEQSIVERIVERGAVDNAKLVLALFAFLAPGVVAIGVGLVARRRRVDKPRIQPVHLIGVGLALLITFTMLASPKHGYRMYFAPICLIAAALAGWLVDQIGRVERWIVAGLAAAAIAYVGVGLVATYRVAGAEFDARLTLVERAPAGSTLVVPPYSQERSRYFVGDDFTELRIRNAVAVEYGLGAIQLAE